jgi:hypothetical protein
LSEPIIKDTFAINQKFTNSLFTLKEVLFTKPKIFIYIRFLIYARMQLVATTVYSERLWWFYISGCQ